MTTRQSDEKAGAALADRISNILVSELGGDETSERRDEVARLVVQAVRNEGWVPETAK
jgi:phenylpyruvate tautomerase PptA (4-oxalocrotonate tautomerase family)